MAKNAKRRCPSTNSAAWRQARCKRPRRMRYAEGNGLTAPLRLSARCRAGATSFKQVKNKACKGKTAAGQHNTRPAIRGPGMAGCCRTERTAHKQYRHVDGIDPAPRRFRKTENKRLIGHLRNGHAKVEYNNPRYKGGQASSAPNSTARASASQATGPQRQTLRGQAVCRTTRR